MTCLKVWSVTCLKVWSVTYLKVWKESMVGNQKISGKYEVPTLEVKYLTSTQRILKERLGVELTPPPLPGGR